MVRLKKELEFAFHRLQGLSLPVRTPGAALALQGGSRVLKERPLPLVKHRRMDPLLLTDLADRHLFQKMQSQNLRLLFWTVSPARFLAHAAFPRSRKSSLSQISKEDISTEAEQNIFFPSLFGLPNSLRGNQGSPPN
jgi:hypothetical protein